MVKSIRSSEDHVLLLDCGGFFANRGKNLKLKNEISLKAMNLMDYDALNLGSREFSLGIDFLKSTSSAVSFPFVSSNLVYDKIQLPWIKDYIIKNVGGLRVAILGVMPSDALEKVSNPRYVKNLKIITPETALKNLLPEIRKKADLVILLSQLGVEATSLLVNNVHGIDLAISGGRKKPRHTDNNGSTPVVQAGSRGDHLGSLQVTTSDTGEISIGQGKLIDLNKSLPSDDVVSKIIRDAFSDESQERRRLLAEKRRQKLHKEFMEELKSTPEEFFELERKRQTERKRR